ncbi:MAG TPA: hypothetical protein ENK28_13690 [Aliiroseovarius sp.]|nr:hypothetical protein [Aliiroseovarius sp.]
MLKWALALVLTLIAAPVLAATFAIAINDRADADFNAGVQDALAAGADATSLTVFWDDLEQDGVYAPEFDWPAIANRYYPSVGLSLILSIAVLDTVADRRPATLQSRGWDDPELARRFAVFVAELLDRMQDTDLVAINIGNEVDGVLSGSDWETYRQFFRAAKAEVARLRPGVPIGVTMTWEGLRNTPAAQALANEGDVWMINYYPLDSRFRVHDPADMPVQMDAMIAAAAGKPVMLSETGYPSGGCRGSLQGQRDFVETALQAWQDRQAYMPLLTLVWLNDISDDALGFYKSYYGVSNKCFLSYLGTLGLADHTGRDKPALTWLKSR